MNLIDFSYGVMLCYSTDGYETQIHSAYRSIKGLIPIDSHYKNEPGSEQDVEQTEAANSILEE